MKKADPLAGKTSIEVDDLIGLPIICLAQAMQVDIPRRCGEKADMLNLSGTINLAYNGSVFVKEGVGYMLSLLSVDDFLIYNLHCTRPYAIHFALPILRRYQTQD